MGVGLTGWADEVDALYAGDPAAFVAGRDALAKRVRAAGERDAAAAIKGLRRPSVGAWYANVAARASLMSLREWLGLGAEIREAQARLDLRRVGELGGRRAALEDRVVRDLAAHLGALGITASAAGLEELRGTLRAALADPAAADALASGRLERSLSYAGFGEVDVSAALAAMAADLPVAEPGAGSPADGEPAGAAPETSATGEGPPVPAEAPEEAEEGPDPEEQARAEARADLERRRNSARATLTQLDSRVAAATRDTTAAATARARASEAVEAAERALKAAQERLQASASQLGEASRTLEAALRTEREATDERARAEAALRAAERDLDAAP
ncbi:hypothetical protein G7070_06545 [Propioniciclava coleopterorum]|uniref:Uncharacterized protein n=1 Tax=Propioniciclava coleopterorum TaxID=2714937 RepID=A0A6G7Y5N6_9ACTN|nr:hypothetical protein [Propioniciclava coleopterorum]QIK71986.1 hypothetical protein G7070_06545 [Propioniciclava coleopterorum]